MKFVFGLLLVAFATVAAVEDVPQSPVYGYHWREGIKRATQIKGAEERGVGAGAGRIVGGSPTDISDIPWQIGLVIQILWIFNSVCGASLISVERAVTAAHCKFDGQLSAQAFTVVAGSNTLFSGGNRQTAHPDNVIMHGGWNPNTAANDIAVIKLLTLQFNINIRSIALPIASELNNNFNRHFGLASGYGITMDGDSITSTQALHSVEGMVVTNAECAETFGPWVHDSTVCINGHLGRSTCIGDDGGPLAPFWNGRRVLIGVASFVHEEGCQWAHPAAFTRVTSYVAWIRSI